jgi:hypothetical protein
MPRATAILAHVPEPTQRRLFDALQLRVRIDNPDKRT